MALSFPSKLFVPSETPYDDASTSSRSQISGKEAAEFYQSVIASSPDAYCHVAKPQRRKHREKKIKSAVPKNDPANLNALFRLASRGNVEELNKLFDQKLISNINVQDDFGWTQLMSAVYERHYNTVLWLLKHGANPYISNRRGESALDFALKYMARKDFQQLLSDYRRDQPGCSDRNSPPSTKGSSTLNVFCDVCQVTFSDPSHNTSIAHLVRAQSGTQATTRPPYSLSAGNRGYQMMIKLGWDEKSGLGADGQGRKLPVKTILKKDKSGLGSSLKPLERARITHFGPRDERAVKDMARKPSQLKSLFLKKGDVKRKAVREKAFEQSFRREFY